jgi:hypothetical protein
MLPGAKTKVATMACDARSSPRFAIAGECLKAVA